MRQILKPTKRPNYLKQGELDTLANVDFSQNKYLRAPRDIFLFQCFAGCNFEDLVQLTADNIKDDVLVYAPCKAKDEAVSTTVRVPLEKYVLELVTRHKGEDYKGRLFPFVDKHKYNETVKSILKVCGITRSVNVRNPKTGEADTHELWEIPGSILAIRTHVANVYKQIKDPNLVGRMSGHDEGSTAVELSKKGIYVAEDGRTFNANNSKEEAIACLEALLHDMAKNVRSFDQMFFTCLYKIDEDVSNEEITPQKAMQDMHDMIAMKKHVQEVRTSLKKEFGDLKRQRPVASK